MYFLPVGCQHCQNPECVKVCPTQASYIAADGTVQIDKSKCIGCQFCVMSCPYNVRYLNEDERVVEKCTMCNQITAQGGLPQFKPVNMVYQGDDYVLVSVPTGTGDRSILRPGDEVLMTGVTLDGTQILTGD